MTITAKSCAELLRKYNGWRRGGEGLQPEPKEIGLNLDFAIAALESDGDIATLEQEARQMRARMDRLKKQCDELLADAERYRFIRQHETWEPPRNALPKWYGGKVKWIGGSYSCDEIDAIIDAAIANAKG